MRRAFLWGANGPRDLGQLRYAKTDPRALARVISNPRYQFDAEVHEHTHEPHHVLQALRVAAARCRAKDTFLVYFAGHGVLVDGRLYFILDNSCISNISTLFLSRWLLDVFTECLAHAQLLVVDSCHAGAASDREARAISVVQFAPELGSKLILYACDRLESAFELRQLEGGFLTYTLCRALEEAPPGRFSIADAVVTLQNEAELFNRSQSRCNVSIPLPFITGKPQSDFFFDDAGTSRHEHVVAAESSDDLTTTLTKEGARKHAITVIAPDDEHSRIDDAVAKARTLRVASDGDRDRSIATLRIAGNLLTIEDAVGPIFPEAEYPAALDDAMWNLANLGVVHALTDLIGENGVYARELTIECGMIEDGVRRPLPNRGANVQLSDRLYCWVKNISCRKLHIHILNIGVRGKVSLLTNLAPRGSGLYPAEEMMLGESFDGSLLGIVPSWPEGLPRTSPRVDALMIIATASPADLRRLETVEMGMCNSTLSSASRLVQPKACAIRDVSHTEPSVDGFFAAQFTFLLHPARHFESHIDDALTGGCAR